MNADETKELPAAQKISLFSITSEVSFGKPTVMQWYPHWQYFLAIEADIENTTRYVQPTRDNFSAYSIEFARILLGAGSEIDVVARVLCRKLDGQSRADNIEKYIEQITAKFPLLPTMRAVVPRYGFFLEPWRDWERGITPSWWKSHNNVKHERNAHFSDANLENALLAVAGLFCLVLYLIAVSILAACSNRTSNRTITLTLDKEALKASVDKSRAMTRLFRSQLHLLFIGAESERLQAFVKAMKIHLIGRLAILVVCLIVLGAFCLAFVAANNNQAVRRLGFLLVVLSAILSSLPLLASAIYLGVQKIRRLWDGSSK